MLKTALTKLTPLRVLPTARTLSTSGAASSDSSKYFVLQYNYTPDILEKRGPFRGEHLALARALKAEGKVMIAGAFPDQPAGALFVFTTPDKRVVEDFVASDPYVKNGLVTSHSIREWLVAV